MGNSIQDQLLKAGLVTEEEVARAQQPPPGRSRSSRRRGEGGRHARGGRDGKPGAGETGDSRGRGRSERGGAADGARGQAKSAGNSAGKGAATAGKPGAGRPGKNQARRKSGQHAGAPDGPRTGAVAGAWSASGTDHDLAAMSVGLRDAKRRTEDLLKDGKLRSHSPEKRAREMKRQSVLRIIERTRQDRPEAGIAHNFVRGTRIKTIYLTADQHEMFKAGSLVVVGFEGRHSLIPGDKVDELLHIDPDIYLHRFAQESGAASGEEEGYPPVPDDVMW